MKFDLLKDEKIHDTNYMLQTKDEVNNLNFWDAFEKGKHSQLNRKK